jgi:hypothetical protein
MAIWVQAHRQSHPHIRAKVIHDCKDATGKHFARAKSGWLARESLTLLIIKKCLHIVSASNMNVMNNGLSIVHDPGR